MQRGVDRLVIGRLAGPGLIVTRAKVWRRVDEDAGLEQVPDHQGIGPRMLGIEADPPVVKRHEVHRFVIPNVRAALRSGEAEESKDPR